MGTFEDLTGQRFGRLTVIKRVESNKSGTRWLCKCDCGNETVALAPNLKRGNTSSCGCLKKEKMSKLNIKHGKTHTRLFYTWQNMMRRCRDPKNKEYGNYGGRGIAVCDEWKDFETFYAWATANGYTDELTIDRINNDKDYCPENCRFISIQEQQRNRRDNVRYQYGSENLTLPEYAREYGLNLHTLQTRISRGWGIADAIETPARRWNNV